MALAKKNILKHFGRIAPEYEDLRYIDIEPILFIKQKLDNLNGIKAVDVGCGTGGYDIELARLLGNRLTLTAIDLNENMLNIFGDKLAGYNIANISIIKSPAEKLPFYDRCLNCIFSFNAVHHFDLARFLNESAGCLKNEARLFIYTRLQSQNERNIWGRFFPKFLEKEKSLYELPEIKLKINEVPILYLESVRYFKYRRKYTLKQLLMKAENHHYSTFYLYYNPDEFEESLKKFEDNIKNHFKNINKIIWDNENTMLVLRKTDTPFNIIR